MATYRAITPTQTAELDNGTIIGSKVYDATELNGRKLLKGSGVVKFKEVGIKGEAIADGKEFSFSYNQTITGL